MGNESNLDIKLSWYNLLTISLEHLIFINNLLDSEKETIASMGFFKNKELKLKNISSKKIEERILCLEVLIDYINSSKSITWKEWDSQHHRYRNLIEEFSYLEQYKNNENILSDYSDRNREIEIFIECFHKFNNLYKIILKKYQENDLDLTTKIEGSVFRPSFNPNKVKDGEWDYFDYLYAELDYIGRNLDLYHEIIDFDLLHVVRGLRIFKTLN